MFPEWDLTVLGPTLGGDLAACVDSLRYCFGAMFLAYNLYLILRYR